MLEVREIDAFYGEAQALWSASFRVERGEIVTLVGANGAGKTTALRSVAGLLPPRRGRIVLDGDEIAGTPAHRLAARGLVLVPEARQLWPGMSVREHLELGAWCRAARPRAAATMAAVFEMFPVLAKRAGQRAGTLSGGEQQMCAIGRGLMACPRLLLLDEPALGLAPLVVRAIFDAMRAIRARGVTILLVEQNVKHALALADRAYVLESGRVTLAGAARELAGDPRVRREFLGEGAA
ncbi:MAG TPA: ABC transporter ATP-binding protein [Thermoanaerobaculaceae bacterium]|nr:ABC transporter ATP-binding protein [Thermoanaerobaculaceae bacterium]